jgi:hypothetical protein
VVVGTNSHVIEVLIITLARLADMTHVKFTDFHMIHFSLSSDSFPLLKVPERTVIQNFVGKRGAPLVILMPGKKCSGMPFRFAS